MSNKIIYDENILKKNLIVKGIELKKERILNFDKYPFNIEFVKNFHSITFSSPVTFFIGENGVGKSTFIEALAVSLGLNPEGMQEKLFY